MSKSVARAWWLTVLASLFLGRVLGQACVASGRCEGLPPMSAWMSGYLPYRELLFSQLAILLVMFITIYSLVKKFSFWDYPQPRLARVARYFGWLYLSIMIVRFFFYLRFTISGQAFLGGWIPIVFHWVLASFILICARQLHEGGERPKKLSDPLCLIPLTLFSAALFGATALSGCNPVSTYLNSKLRAEAPTYSFRTATEMISMRDGVKLKTDLYEILSKETRPTILIRLPLPSGLKFSLFASAVAQTFATRGYNVVVQQIRGWLPSEGKFTPFVNERTDGEDTIKWLIRRGASPEAIYSWGGSYFGYTQWAVGDLIGGAKVIQLASPRLNEVFFPGGLLDLGTALFWTARNSGKLASVEEILRASLSGPIEEADQRLLGQRVSYFKEWLTPAASPDDWQRSLNTAQSPEVKGPVLLMAGWFDPFLSAQLSDFSALNLRDFPTAIVIGPWGHATTIDLSGTGVQGRNYRLESLEYALEWFSKVDLSPEEGRNQPTQIPAVRYYILGENRWATSSSWPPNNAQVTELSLNLLSQPDHESLSAPRNFWQFSPLDPLPRLLGVDLGFAIGFADLSLWRDEPKALLLETSEQEQSCIVLGQPKLTLELKLSHTPVPLTAFLGEKLPNGEIRSFVEGQLLLREGRGEKTSFVFDLLLRPTAYRFQKGSRLVVGLTGGNFPRTVLPVSELEKLNRKLLNGGDKKVTYSVLLPDSAANTTSSKLHLPLAECRGVSQ